jgi:hypothetical protein
VSEAAAQPPADAGVFAARTVIALLVAGVFAFSAFMVLSAYAPDLRGADDGQGHALSRSAIGFAGVVQLLKDMGQPVVVSRDAKAQTASTSLYVLTPTAFPAKDDLNALTRGGPTLIVMPKWETIPSRSTQGWVDTLGPLPLPQVVDVLSQRFTGVKMVRDNGKASARISGLPGGELTTGPIDRLQTFVDDPDIVLRDAQGRGILTKSHTEPVYILSDPDLLNTQGIKTLATARAGVAILDSLRKGDGPILFDVTLDGLGRSRSLLKLAFEPPFLGATICLGAAALLLALQALSRFGAPRREGRAIALGKQALADNSAALIRLARREPHMAARYLELTRARVARALGAGRLGEAELTALLDRQAARAGASHRLADLATQAEAVRDRAGLIRLARDLTQWKTEMTGERR